jgi:hypothetical protein
MKTAIHVLADEMNPSGLRNGLLLFVVIVVGSALVSLLLIRAVRRATVGKEGTNQRAKTPATLEKENDHG